MNNSDGQKKTESIDFASLSEEESCFLFRSVFEQSSDAVIITDPKNNITFFNPAAVRMFGMDAEQLSRQNINSLAFGRRIILPDELKKLSKGEYPEGLRAENLFMTKNGFFWGHTAISVITGNGRGKQRILFVIRDITTEKNLREELFTSREQLQNMLDFVNSMVVVTNGTEMRNCNKNLLNFFGYESLPDFKENNGCVCDMFVPMNGYLTESRRGHWLKKVLRNKASSGDTKVAIKDPKTGSVRFFLVDIQPFPGEKYYYIVSFTDITELENQKKLLEDTNISLEEKINRRSRELFESYRKLAANEEMLSVIFNMASIGIAMVDDKGRYVRVNGRFCEMYRLKEFNIINSAFETVLHETLREDMRRLFMKYRDGHLKRIASEWKIRRVDDTVMDMLMTTKWVTMYDGKRYLISTHLDITDKNKLQQKQREQERMLVQQSKMAAMGEMIGAIAHQWKQPLNAIALIAQCFKDDYDYKELTLDAVNEHVSGILKQVNFMAATIDDFRNFFKPARTMQEFKISSAVADIVNLMLPQLKVNYIAVYVDDTGTEKCGSEVYGYPNEFKQVILNLIANSKDAIAERRSRKTLKNSEAGIINIKIESNEQQVKITFADNGGGIPDEAMSRLFEPYFTTKGSGSGIGLYMCRTIIEGKMKGKISARNTGDGAAFTIVLEKFIEGSSE
ncbi:PAS domain S-box protein [Geovibrio thiophilus]|uniref:PAS domain S-box protein n=1 Tax=Geovibrio thiophilus TaxID=139438 RepID=UPI0013E3E980|nr:PAS domain S-box protein [Geovibrio thiophilus]